MQFLIPPFKHQLEALERAKDKDCFGLYWEMGTGKTKGAVEILRAKYTQHGRRLRTFILTPSATIYNWKDEILKNSKLHKDDVVLLNQKSSRAKMKNLENWLSSPSDGALTNNKIVITNYETMLCKEFVEMITEWNPEMLICDEVHYCKNRAAKRSKAVIKLANKTMYRYILTGTPILKNVEDLFSQFLILDNGLTFGKNFNVFRAKYMTDANAAFANSQNYFPKWETRPEMYDELTQHIYKKTMRVTKEECLDLPPFLEETRWVSMSAEMTKLYKEMSRDLLTYIQKVEKDGVKNKAVTANIAVVKAMRLQQIVSGFVKTEDGDNIHIADNPRARITKELLEELTPEHKVIVWCAFKENYKIVSKLCEELNVDYRLITGDQDATGKRKSELDFQTDPNVRVLVANRSAGGVGINLTAASYSIVYSRNFSLGEELQSDARNYRAGSEVHEKITKINLISKGTIEEQVVAALRDKKHISDRVIDFVKHSLGG